MREAIKCVRNGEMGCKKASKLFGIPRMTLKRRVNNSNQDATEDRKILGSKRPVFTSEQEKELVDYLLKMETMFYGLTIKDVRHLAFQLAERNKIKHPFNKESGLAGEDWFYGFRARHPELTLRSPEATSIARAQAFNKPNVQNFFSLLTNVLDEKKFPPHRIFNVDETSVTTVQAKSNKVLAQRGKKQVGTITSAERGVLSTAVICMSASGTFIPPMIIFPRLRMKAELTDGAPPGTIFSCNASGWMQLETFSSWFDHFLVHVKPTDSDPALLIMDGHMTHTKNLDVINRARANNVTLLTIPPHCSHKLQPLDVSFMFPLNTFYVAAVEKFLRNNPGRALTQFQVSKLFGEAYLRAATPTTAINGFRKCGICPLNPNVFEEADFAASLPTDRPHSSVENLDDIRNIQNEPVPSTSSETPIVPDSPEDSPQPSSSFTVNPEEISPLPNSTQVRSQKRKRGSAAILTSSPYKRQLTEERENKAAKEREKEMKKNKQSANNGVRRNILATQPTVTKNKATEKRQQRKSKITVQEESSSEDGSDNDTDCMFCRDTYLRSTGGEGWIRCSTCLEWAHEECAGVEDEECDDFTCDFCLRKLKNKTK